MRVTLSFLQDLTLHEMLHICLGGILQLSFEVDKYLQSIVLKFCIPTHLIWTAMYCNMAKHPRWII